MRVVVNQTVSLGRKAGVGHYTNQLLRSMRALGHDLEIDAFPKASLRRVYQAASRARRQLTSLGSTHTRRESGFHAWAFECLREGTQALLGRYFRAACRKDRYDLYHEPNAIPFDSDLPVLTTVHDLSVVLHPEWHPPGRVKHYAQRFRRRLESSAHFLAVSEFTRQEVIRHLNVSPDRITRTYCGVRRGLGPTPVEEVRVVLEQLGLPSQYLLYLGTIEPRKNILTLLRAYVALPAPLRADWPLLLVGTWGWRSGDVADYLYNIARHQGVIHVGYVNERHLSAIYSGARALLYPSWYEGFGLPPLEMMACGGAVLASTAGALAETIGGKAHLIEPGDVDGWRNGIANVIELDDWWRSLRNGVQAVARPFTWDRCAAETLQVYRTIAGKPLAGRAAPIVPLRAAG